MSCKLLLESWNEEVGKLEKEEKKNLKQEHDFLIFLIWYE
jgi:hypothetical protein